MEQWRRLSLLLTRSMSGRGNFFWSRGFGVTSEVMRHWALAIAFSTDDDLWIQLGKTVHVRCFSASYTLFFNSGAHMSSSSMLSIHLLFLLSTLAAAIPSFDGPVRQSTISSLVGPTAAYIEALPLGPKDTNPEPLVHHLGLDPSGVPSSSQLLHLLIPFQVNLETSLFYPIPNFYHSSMFTTTSCGSLTTSPPFSVSIQSTQQRPLATLYN